MTGAAAVASWRDMELAAPQIAALGMAQLTSARVALLGTLRRDGSPRISPIEPYFAEGQLLIGAMAWTAKAADLRHDPRYVLHSAVTGPDSGEGELKLSGPAAEAGHDLRRAAAHAWWLTLEPDKAAVFTLHISQAVFIDWDIKDGLMTIHRWSPPRGYSIAHAPTRKRQPTTGLGQINSPQAAPPPMRQRNEANVGGRGTSVVLRDRERGSLFDYGA